MTDKTQPTAHAEITAPISADLRGINGGALPAPITYMTEDRACKWAWDQVQQDVGTKGWTAGDSGNFFGFFLWGWNYRGQYETQRPAAPPAPAAVAVPEGVNVDAWRKGARFALEAVSKVDPICWLTDSMREICIKQAADEVIAERDRLLAAAPAQEHATQLAGQGQHPDDVAVDALAAAMKAKLARQRAKGYSGWNSQACTQQRLSEMLRAHVDKGDPVDVANFCAFLDARGEGIAPAQAQEDARDAVERAERYEEALRHIAENAFANKDWTFAQLVLNGRTVAAARAAQGGAA